MAPGRAEAVPAPVDPLRAGAPVPPADGKKKRSRNPSRTAQSAEPPRRGSNAGNDAVIAPAERRKRSGSFDSQLPEASPPRPAPQRAGSNHMVGEDAAPSGITAQVRTRAKEVAHRQSA